MSSTSQFVALRKADFKKLGKEIHDEEMRRMEKAGDHVRKKILEKIDSLGIGKHSGNLKKGIRKKRLSNAVLVGAMRPAYHAHWLELGTDDRFVKNYQGHKGWEIPVGKITKTPFIMPTFQEESGKVKEIMSEPVV